MADLLSSSDGMDAVLFFGGFLFDFTVRRGGLARTNAPTWYGSATEQGRGGDPKLSLNVNWGCKQHGAEKYGAATMHDRRQCVRISRRPRWRGAAQKGSVI